MLIIQDVVLKDNILNIQKCQLECQLHANNMFLFI